MSYSFLYTAAALLGLITPMDQALMNALENPSMERGGLGAPPLPPPAPLRPRGGRWRIEGGREGAAAVGADPAAAGRRPTAYAAHLASYLGETWANRGWQELKRRSPQLVNRDGDFRHADVPALGAVVRLTIGRYATLAEAAAACAELKRSVDYCAPLPLYDGKP